jgi:hypothetical protein
VNAPAPEGGALSAAREFAERLLENSPSAIGACSLAAMSVFCVPSSKLIDRNHLDFGTPAGFEKPASRAAEVGA